MAAYVVVDILKVKDEAKWAEYRSKVPPIVEKFGGKYLAVGGPFEVVEGNWRPVHPVILQFPSAERVHVWYNSEEYRDLKKLRMEATETNAVLVDGVPEK